MILPPNPKSSVIKVHFRNQLRWNGSYHVACSTSNLEASVPTHSQTVAECQSGIKSVLHAQSGQVRTVRTGMVINTVIGWELVSLNPRICGVSDRKRFWSSSPCRNIPRSMLTELDASVRDLRGTRAGVLR